MAIICSKCYYEEYNINPKHLCVTICMYVFFRQQGVSRSKMMLIYVIRSPCAEKYATKKSTSKNSFSV